jgi:dihydropteroate synthase
VAFLFSIRGFMQDWVVSQKIRFDSTFCSIMGILNTTPDSFFDGGAHNQFEKACAHAQKMVEEGASLIDVGGESTRPGAKLVEVQEEIDRTAPVIEWCSKNLPSHIALSIDTTKAKVAQAAMSAGAHIVNDISALKQDPEMLPWVCESRPALVLNHMQGTPQTMQINPTYQNCTLEVLHDLLKTCDVLLQNGYQKEQICLDPGIGFGKALEHNLELLKNTPLFVQSGFPVLVGTSRKSFIPKIQGLEQSDRLIPSVVSALYVAQLGVRVVRVHDVKATREAFTLWESLR